MIRLPTFVAATGASLAVLNSVLYAWLPVPRLHGPLGVRIEVRWAGWVAAALIASAVGALAIRSLRRRRLSRPTVAVLLAIGASAMIGPVAERARVTRIPLSDGDVVLSYVSFSPSSPVIERIRYDVARQRAALEPLFGTSPERIRIVLFPSRKAMHQAMGAGIGAPRARADFLTHSVFVAVADWSGSHRHELVHLFQSEAARGSLAARLRFLFRHDACATEGLAYYLDPTSGDNSARPIDYLHALPRDEAGWRGVLRGRAIDGLTEADSESMLRYLCTRPFHEAGSDSLAVASYLHGVDSTWVARPLPRGLGPRDPATEAFLSSVFEGSVPVARPRPPWFRTIDAFRRDASRPLTERRAIAAWNLRHTTSVQGRIGWEMILDTLGGRNAPSRGAEALYRAAQLAAEAPLVRSEDVARSVQTLRALLEESVALGYDGVAAHIHPRLVDLERMNGAISPTPMPAEVAARANLFARQRHHTAEDAFRPGLRAGTTGSPASEPPP